MHTSRFQLGLMATLAIGLGYTLASSQAIGYPGGAAISTGTNPVVSFGGQVTHSSDNTVLTAPSDQDVIVTDVILSSYSDISCKRSHHSSLSLSSGDIVATFETNSPWAYRHYDYDSDNGQSVNHSFASGLRIPAGESLSLAVTQTGNYGGCSSSSSYGGRHTVSGYQAQP